MFKFIIKRSEWLRGRPQASYLLSPDNGKMCCLGFLALACGYTKDNIKGMLIPSDVGGHKFVPGIVTDESNSNTNICEQLMYINDEVQIEEADREATLTKLFNNIEIQPEFID